MPDNPHIDLIESAAERVPRMRRTVAPRSRNNCNAVQKNFPSCWPGTPAYTHSDFFSFALERNGMPCSAQPSKR